MFDIRLVLKNIVLQLFGGKSPKEINDEYLNDAGKKSFAAALQGTRVYVRLETDAHLKTQAFNRLLSFDYPDVNIQVQFHRITSYFFIH